MPAPFTIQDATRAVVYMFVASQAYGSFTRSDFEKGREQGKIRGKVNTIVYAAKKLGLITLKKKKYVWVGELPPSKEMGEQFYDVYQQKTHDGTERAKELKNGTNLHDAEQLGMGDDWIVVENQDVIDEMNDMKAEIQQRIELLETNFSKQLLSLARMLNRMNANINAVGEKVSAEVPFKDVKGNSGKTWREMVGITTEAAGEVSVTND